ncbi:MAG: VTC domain-containing protein [Defluviitaleaceae bacterium]|nr:VTC domain-containing protein [Defluviitaleaceae bacterium]
MRIEIKYYIDSKDISGIIDFSTKYGIMDKYCVNEFGYKIQSTYIYEWEEHYQDLRGKLRLRNYFNTKYNNYFIEEKIKSGIWGTKNRCAISENEYQAINNTSDTKTLRKNLYINNLAFFKSLPLEGRLFNLRIQYSRFAWVVEYQDIKFRLTIDRDIKCCIYDGYQHIVPPGTYILEIKGDKDLYSILDIFYKMFEVLPEKISKLDLGKKMLEDLKENSYMGDVVT